MPYPSLGNSKNWFWNDNKTICIASEKGALKKQEANNIFSALLHLLMLSMIGFQKWIFFKDDVFRLREDVFPVASFQLFPHLKKLWIIYQRKHLIRKRDVSTIHPCLSGILNKPKWHHFINVSLPFVWMARSFFFK